MDYRWQVKFNNLNNNFSQQPPFSLVRLVQHVDNLDFEVRNGKLTRGKFSVFFLGHEKCLGDRGGSNLLAIIISL